MIEVPADFRPEALVPLWILAGLFLINFLMEVVRRRESQTTAGFWTLLASALGCCYLVGCPEQSVGPTLNQMWQYDGITRAGSLIIFIALFLTTLVVPRAIAASGFLGEYYILLSGAALGMVMLIGSNNLLVSFLAIELFSLSLYLLCIFLPERPTGQEAALKYFILSSLASAVLLYGMALVYGATGSTWLHEIASASHQSGMLLLIGSVLMAAGLCFKVSAVPFHVWTPDVYEGAPTTVTAFMSVATKAAALVALLRFFPLTLGMAAGPQEQVQLQWWIILWSLSILSILFGNLMALSQTNLKRLLAYSGIAQAGYLLSAIFVATPQAQVSLFYYLLVYVFMNVGAFLAVAAMEESGEGLSMEELKGLSMRHPLLAACLAVFLFSLTGLPPTAGFLAKYHLFTSLLAAPGGLLPRYLVAAGLVGALLSAGYYLKVVVHIYSPGPISEPNRELPASTLLAVVVSALGVLALFLAAHPVLGWLHSILLG
jgi:NADH-quinone oxidoreductase subunit N